MPIVAVMNAKGGSGKSTTALILATEMARRGARVLMLDCDPNQPLVRWAAAGGQPVSVEGSITDSALVPILDREASARDLLLVDLEGTANRMASRALSRADLALVPMQPTALDAVEAHRTLAVIREEEQIQRRAIPARIVLTRTLMVASRDERAILRELDAKAIPRLATGLVQRAPFAALFSQRTTLDRMQPDQVSGLDQAKANAAKLADELVAILKSLVVGRAAA